MTLLSHPTGNEFVRALLRAFQDAGQLALFCTTLGVRHEDGRWRRLPGRWRREFRRRAYDLPPGKLSTHPWRDLARLLAEAAGFSPIIRQERGWACIDAVYRDLDLHVARSLEQRAAPAEVTSVYAYEDAALRTFEVARTMGIRCIYDLPIGYWRAGRAIQQEEAERHPQWAATMRGLADSEKKLGRKDRELAAAEVIIVASSFTAQTLAAAPSLTAPVHVLPYGAPPVAAETGRAPNAGKLRVLFVGLLSQRKGISYLLEAMEDLKTHAVLTLIGRTLALTPPLERALKKHRWIASLPHPEVLEEMRRHDVLVFPSLFEGFGLVILEALSQGLPVITTPHTAGPDVLTDGKDGFIVPIRSAGAIAEKLELLVRDRGRLEAMRHAARGAAARFTWEAYGKAVLAVTAKAAADGRDILP